jgi:hypothetical protein
MKDLRYKHYRLYKAIANGCFYFSLIGLGLAVALFFMPFTKYTAATTLGFGKGSVGYFYYTGKLEGCYLQLNNVVAIRNSGNNLNDGKLVIDAGSTNYQANYSAMANLLRIEISPSLADYLKRLVIPIGIAAYLIIIAVLYLMRKILFSLQNGTPFTLRNARLISIIALILVLLPVARTIAENLLEWYLGFRFNVVFGNSIGPDATDMTCFFGGVVVAILSYVIKQGVILKEEQDFTI